MENSTGQAVSSEQWLAYLAQGGTLKTLRNIDEPQLDTVYSVAYSRFNSGHYEDALMMFRHLCLLDHTQYAYFLGLGLAQFELSQFNRAAATLTHAAKLDRSNPEALLIAGKCFVELKRWPLADSALAEALTRATGSDRWQSEQQEIQQLLTQIGRKPD